MPERRLGTDQDFSRQNLANIAAEFAREFGKMSHWEEIPIYNKGRWSKIAEVVRDNHPDFQRAQALHFFGPEGGNFPNGVELANFLVRLNNIKWFSSDVPLDRDELQSSVDEVATDFNLSRMRAQVIIGNWERTLIDGVNEPFDMMIDSMKVPVFDALKRSGRWQAACVAMEAAEGCVNAAVHKGWELTRDVSGKAWGATRSAAANAGIYAKYGAVSIVAYDVIDPRVGTTANFKKSNPTDGLFKIYEMGAVPVGATHNGAFVIFRPTN